MAALGAASPTSRRPALHNLDASADAAHDASSTTSARSPTPRGPAFRSLGQASQTGDKAVKAAPPVIAQLERLRRRHAGARQEPRDRPQHLDDRKHAVEKDPRSPGRPGLHRPRGAAPVRLRPDDVDVDLTTRTTTSSRSARSSGRAPTTPTTTTLKKDPERSSSECGSRLGPNQPGLNYPDVTDARRPATPSAARRRKRADGDHGLPLPAVPAPVDPPRRGARGPATPSLPACRSPTPTVPTPTVPGLPPVDLPPLPGARQRHRPRSAPSPRPPCPSSARRPAATAQAQTRLLDYLLGP